MQNEMNKGHDNGLILNKVTTWLATHAGSRKWPWTSENQAIHAADVRGFVFPPYPQMPA